MANSGACFRRCSQVEIPAGPAPTIITLGSIFVLDKDFSETKEVKKLTVPNTFVTLIWVDPLEQNILCALRSHADLNADIPTYPDQGM